MLFEDRATFLLQISKYGFFAEQIPPCFCSDEFAQFSDVLFQSAVKKINPTAPTTLSIYKSDTARRIISAINPLAFAHTANLLYQHRKQLEVLCESAHSESPITFIHTYNSAEMRSINTDLARAAHKARSSYTSNLRERVALAIGCRYRLCLDISTFYDSIYTHSIAWAICGKQEAKRMYSSSIGKTPEYQFADDLDRAMRNQKNAETNGIVTGPFTSRIFSELLLARIDRELDKKKYIFKRYVDDYKFYFRSESEARHAVIDIAKTLGKYNLAINQSKISIAEYPFDLESDLRRRLESAFETSGLYGALNEAGKLYTEGERGSYKYALKQFKDAVVPERDLRAVLSLLFNANLIIPQLARYLVDVLANGKKTLGADRLSEIINSELSKSLREGYEQEVLNLLFFLKSLNLELLGSNLRQALDMQNDFISIVVLDIWKHHNSSVQRSRSEAKQINERIKDLELNMKQESLDGEHWLLLFESKMHGLLDVGNSDGKSAWFFEEMEKRKISFYLA